MYVASRGLLKMKKPTVIVPRCVKDTVEKLFLIQRELDGSDLPVNLIGLDVSIQFSSPIMACLLVCHAGTVFCVYSQPLHRCLGMYFKLPAKAHSCHQGHFQESLRETLLTVVSRLFRRPDI
jgi:hypothetical protein